MPKLKIALPKDSTIRRIIIDELGEAVDSLHGEADRVHDGVDQKLREAADFISELRKQIQRG